MQSFFRNRELVSFSLVEEINVVPDDFVQTSETTKTKGWKRSHTKEEILPDGTKHGKHFKKILGNDWRMKRTIDYKLGKIHGSFFHSSKAGLVSFKCGGCFEGGIPTGAFLFRDGTEEEFLVFDKGFPIFFYGEEENFPILWEKDTVSLKGKKYTELFTSTEQEFLFSEYPLGAVLSSTLFLIEKYSQQIYGINENGEGVKIHIPVFFE